MACRVLVRDNQGRAKRPAINAHAVLHVLVQRMGFLNALGYYQQHGQRRPAHALAVSLQRCNALGQHGLHQGIGTKAVIGNVALSPHVLANADVGLHRLLDPCLAFFMRHMVKVWIDQALCPSSSISALRVAKAEPDRNGASIVALLHQVVAIGVGVVGLDTVPVVIGLPAHIAMTGKHSNLSV